MKRHVIGVLLERFSGWVLSTIGYADCEDFFIERKNTPTKNGRPRTASAINKEVNTLRHMLKKAVSWGMLERNPFEGGESLRLKENTQRLRFLSEDEIEVLLRECPPYLGDIVEVDILTGMRRSELLSLKWTQVAGGFIYLAETKTEEPRQLPMPKDLDAVLRRVRKRQWAKGIRSEYVLCDDQGRRFAEVKRSFASACKRAGITEFRFHDLRHTFVSHYLMRGGSLKGLQKRLGHKDIRMTMRYAHLSKEFDTEEIQVMNGLTARTPEISTCHKTVTSKEKGLTTIG